MKRVILLTALFLGAVAPPVTADAGWFESGDTILRNDLLLLNDSGVIRLPVNQWPIPRSAVRFAIENGREHLATNRAVMMALDRVRARLGYAGHDRVRGFTFDSSISAGSEAVHPDSFRNQGK